MESVSSERKKKKRVLGTVTKTLCQDKKNCRTRCFLDLPNKKKSIPFKGGPVKGVGQNEWGKKESEQIFKAANTRIGGPRSNLSRQPQEEKEKSMSIGKKEEEKKKIGFSCHHGERLVPQHLKKKRKSRGFC